MNETAVAIVGLAVGLLIILAWLAFSAFVIIVLTKAILSNPDPVIEETDEE